MKLRRWMLCAVAPLLLAAVGPTPALANSSLLSAQDDSKEERNVYLHDPSKVLRGPNTHAIFTDGTDEAKGMQFHLTRQELEDNGVRTIDPPYPAELYPVAGELTLDESVAIGVSLAVDAAVADLERDPDATQVFVGFSQGDIVAYLAAQEMVRLGVPPSQIKVMTVGDTQTPYTGVQHTAREMGLTEPFPGAVLRDRPYVDGVEYYSLCYAGDLMCNAENPYVNPGGFMQQSLGYIMIHAGAFGPNNYYQPVDSRRIREKTVDGGTLYIVDTPPPLVVALDTVGVTLPEETLEMILDASPMTDPGSKEKAMPVYPEQPIYEPPTVQDVRDATHQVIDSLAVTVQQKQVAHIAVDDVMAATGQIAQIQLPELHETISHVVQDALSELAQEFIAAA